VRGAFSTELVRRDVVNCGHAGHDRPFGAVYCLFPRVSGHVPSRRVSATGSLAAAMGRMFGVGSRVRVNCQEPLHYFHSSQ
jgi:hypothetical protein